MKIFFFCALLALSGIADAQRRTLLAGLAGAAIGYGLAQSQQQRGGFVGAPIAGPGIVGPGPAGYVGGAVPFQAAVGGAVPIPGPVAGAIPIPGPVAGAIPIPGPVAGPIPIAGPVAGPIPVQAGFTAGSFGVAQQAPLVAGPAPVFAGGITAAAPYAPLPVGGPAPFVGTQVIAGAAPAPAPIPITTQSFQSVAPPTPVIAQSPQLVGVQQVGLTATAPAVSTIAQSVPVAPAFGYQTSTYQTAPTQFVASAMPAVSASLPMAASYESAYIAQPPQATYIQEQSIPAVVSPAYSSTVATTTPVVAGVSVPAHYHYAGGSQIACAEPHAVATAY